MIPQKYIHPWLFGITTPTKSPQETLMETCNAILSSVDLLKKSMVSLESSLDRHSNKLDEVSQNMLEVWIQKIQNTNIFLYFFRLLPSTAPP